MELSYSIFKLGNTERKVIDNEEVEAELITQGWTKVKSGVDVYNEDVTIMKYSKLAIKRKLDYMHKWDMVKNLITDFGYWDDFLLASYISADDPILVMIRKAVVEHGIMAEQTMDELLAECIWTAE